MDWNGDGLDDIIVGDRNGFVTFFKRTGSGVNELTSEGHLEANGTAIDVGGNSAPVVVDWNNDGLLDLLIANESASQGIRLYLNSGTATNPVITTWSYIQSSGSDINRYRCCPQVYDMNSDGKKDLIMGENNAQIYYYENTGTDDNPVFSGFEAIQSNGSPLDLYSGTRLCVDDWDNDGIPDLFVSDFNGFVHVFMADLSAVAEEVSAQITTGFSVSPLMNPVTGYFNVSVQSSSSTAVALMVFDSAGRQVATTDVSGNSSEVSISASSMPTGVYTIVATSGDDVASCRVVLTD